VWHAQSRRPELTFRTAAAAPWNLALPVTAAPEAEGDVGVVANVCAAVCATSAAMRPQAVAAARGGTLRIVARKVRCTEYPGVNMTYKNTQNTISFLLFIQRRRRVMKLTDPDCSVKFRIV